MCIIHIWKNNGKDNRICRICGLEQFRYYSSPLGLRMATRFNPFGDLPSYWSSNRPYEILKERQKSSSDDKTKEKT